MEMTIALPLAMVLSGGIRRDLRLLLLTAVSLMAVALVLSGSRGGLVALVAELIILLMMTTRRTADRTGFYLKVALSAALLVAVVGGAMFVGGESSLTRIAETAASRDVTTSRTQIWLTTLQVVASNLPFGAGLGALGVAYTPLDQMSGLERVEQAHNDYLQIASDAGIVGILIAGAFLYLLVRTGLRNIHRQNDLRRAVAIGAFAGISAVLIHSIFDFVLHTTAISVLFLLMLSLLSASGQKYDDDIRNEDQSRRHRRKGSVHSMSTRRV
jgi:O-antigen ligase